MVSNFFSHLKNLKIPNTILIYIFIQFAIEHYEKFMGMYRSFMAQWKRKQWICFNISLVVITNKKAQET